MCSSSPSLIRIWSSRLILSFQKIILNLGKAGNAVQQSKLWCWIRFGRFWIFSDQLWPCILFFMFWKYLYFSKVPSFFHPVIVRLIEKKLIAGVGIVTLWWQTKMCTYVLNYQDKIHRHFSKLDRMVELFFTCLNLRLLYAVTIHSKSWWD